VEPCIAHSEACELARVFVGVIAALHCQVDEVFLLDVCIEVVTVPAYVAYQIAHFRSDCGVFAFNHYFRFFNDFSFLNFWILIFA